MSLSLAWPFCFYSKTGFWPSYSQISTYLDKILHTPTAVRNTLVGRLIPRSARGRLQEKPESLCFPPILVTHPDSHIEPTHRRDFGGKISKWRWGRVLSWKNPEFFSVGGARSPKQHFSRFRVPFDYSAHSQPTGNSFTPNQWYWWKAEALKMCLLLVWIVY